MTANESNGMSTCETHLSRLFFTPDRVFKLLKPVALPFVDFTDDGVRCRAATVEYERNHAISPDVYLGVADIHENGVLRDRMLVMRRLPAEREFRHLLTTQTASDAVIRQVARHVARIHAGLDPLNGSSAEPASLAAITQNWEDNFAAIQPHVGRAIEPEEFDTVSAMARAYLAGRAPLFEKRIADGWVRDGHGDLRAEHVYCTDDGPQLIDCVAFDDRLRISDTLADIAFLAMDIDRLAGPAASVTLIHAWNEFTNEHHPSSLAYFYVAYRAHVRCKIACLRLAAGQSEAADSARAYHRLARRHLELAMVQVVLVGGGPGTGKSTIAQAVAQTIGAVWLRSDEVRKDVAGMAHDAHAFEEPDQGIYDHEVSAKTREELLRQTRLLLSNGVSVVLDATWGSAAARSQVRRVAADCSVEVTELRCDLPAPIAKERIARRMASIYNPSDATPALVDYLAERFDEWPESATIDTSGSIASSVEAARTAILRRFDRSLTEAPVDPPVHRFVVDMAVLRRAALIQEGLGATAPTQPTQ